MNCGACTSRRWRLRVGLCDCLRLGGTGFGIAPRLRLVAAEAEEGADASEAIETVETVSFIPSDIFNVP